MIIMMMVVITITLIKKQEIKAKFHCQFLFIEIFTESIKFKLSLIKSIDRLQGSVNIDVKRLQLK